MNCNVLQQNWPKTETTRIDQIQEWQQIHTNLNPNKEYSAAKQDEAIIIYEKPNRQEPVSVINELKPARTG